MEMRRTSAMGRGREFCFSFSTILLWSRQAPWTLQMITGPTDNGPCRIQSQPSGKTQARGQNSGNPGWAEAERWRDECTWSTKRLNTLPAGLNLPWNWGRHASCWGWGRPCKSGGPMPDWWAFLSWDYNLPHPDIAAWFGPLWGWGQQPQTSVPKLHGFTLYSY